METVKFRSLDRVGFRVENLFPKLKPVEPSDWVRQSIRVGLGVGVSNERARAERLVTPVLLELCERNNRSFSVYSDAESASSQEPRSKHSFTCSFGRVPDFITAPVFLVVDTCYRETDEELTLLLQQLIAARHLNEQEKKTIRTIYGCSTTGIEWRFLKYEGNEFILDQQRFFLSELPALLGALQAVVDAARSGGAETGVSSRR